MRRRQRGRAVHGWLVIDKPGGMTSTAVVNKVKWLLDARKAGHGGTLDPMATGILPVAFGEATKTVSHIMDGSKSYRFTLRWGAETNTDDADGEMVKENNFRPDRATVKDVLTRFVGRIEQVPPQFSAVKINGVRAYKLARANRTVALNAREIDIHEIRIISAPDADHTEFAVISGKGAYMRALARDIARAAGGFGHISALRRTAVGPFDAEDAISLDELGSFSQIAAREQKLLPVETALDDIPALAVTESEAVRLKNGQPVSLLRKADLKRIAELDNGDTVLAKTRTKPVALVRYAAGAVKPFRVLNL